MSLHYLYTMLLHYTSRIARKNNGCPSFTQQHHISLKEFESGNDKRITLKRYSRMDYLKLPKVDFYQLKINYDTLVVEEAKPETDIPLSADSAYIGGDIIKTTDLSMSQENTTISVDNTERGTKPATFNSWLYGIVKGGFGSITMSELLVYEELLKEVFDKITYEKDGSRYYSSKYDRNAVESNIRKAFCNKEDFNTSEECIPEEANLLNITNFKSEISTDKPQDYYPEQKIVENIILDDKGKLKVDEKTQQLIDLAIETGNDAIVTALKAQTTSHINKDRSFHYLPYRTDSSFEQTFLKEVLSFDEMENLGLEVYYNGDRGMTEFKIKCYKRSGSRWRYVGLYTPDFLIIKRKDGQIHKIIIVETKGQIYANDPTFKDKRTFMETEFSKQNNTAFGYERFDYLYLEDTLPDRDRILLTQKKICEFFEEE